MSTSPPFVASAEPQSAGQPSQPGLSQAARIVNTFIAPRKTFEDLKRNASWWAPWLVTAIFSILMSAIVIQKVDLAQMLEKQIEQSRIAKTQMEQLSPAQREQATEFRVIGKKIEYSIRPILILIGGLIVAAIFMAVFNFGFAAEVPFSQALAIAFYAWLPSIMKSALVCVSLLVSTDSSGFDELNPVATNPGFFMDREAHKFLWGLATGLDAITIWTFILLAIGFTVASKNKKLTTQTAITVILAVYALFAVLGAAIGAVL